MPLDHYPVMVLRQCCKCIKSGSGKEENTWEHSSVSESWICITFSVKAPNKMRIVIKHSSVIDNYMKKKLSKGKIVKGLSNCVPDGHKLNTSVHYISVFSDSFSK